MQQTPSQMTKWLQASYLHSLSNVFPSFRRKSWHSFFIVNYIANSIGFRGEELHKSRWKLKKRTKAKTTNADFFPSTQDRWNVLLGLCPIVSIIPKLLIIHLWILCKSQISKITTISQLILKLSLFSTIFDLLLCCQCV